MSELALFSVYVTEGIILAIRLLLDKSLDRSQLLLHMIYFPVLAQIIDYYSAYGIFKFVSLLSGNSAPDDVFKLPDAYMYIFISSCAFYIFHCVLFKYASPQYSILTAPASVTIYAYSAIYGLGFIGFSKFLVFLFKRLSKR